MANRLKIMAVLTAAFHLMVGAQGHDTVPVLMGENLEREAFQFPKDLKKDSTVLVAGFSQNSSLNLESCLLKLEKDFPGLAFSMVMLDGVPFFMRPRVKKTMRSRVPDERKARFLLFFEGRKAMEQFAEYSAHNENDAYVIGLKSKSIDIYSVSFKKHGSCDDVGYESLRTAIEHMLSSERLAAPPMKKMESRLAHRQNGISPA